MEDLTNKITNEQLDELVIKSNCPMNSLGIVIPYSYFSGLVKLNWYDILFATDNNYLSQKSVVEHAVVEMDENPNYQKTVLDLAILSPDEVALAYEIHKPLIELAKQVSDEEKCGSKSKILYVLLKWIFENRECYLDPLTVVEIIYADFNYPESIISFVRYMPSTKPLYGTTEANIEQMYNNWKSYLEVNG